MNTHITNLQLFKIEQMAKKQPKIATALSDFYKNLNRLNRINREIETIAQSELSAETKENAIAELLKIR